MYSARTVEMEDLDTVEWCRHEIPRIRPTVDPALGIIDQRGNMVPIGGGICRAELMSLRSIPSS